MPHRSIAALPGAAHLRRLCTQGAVYTFGMLLARLCSLVLIPVYTHLLHPAEFGVLELVDTADLVVVVILSAALTDPILRFFTRATTDDARARVVSSITLAILALGAVTTAMALACSTALTSLIFHGTAYVGVLRLALAAVAFQAVIEVPLALLRATDRPGLWVATILGRHVFGLALNVFFLVGCHMGVRGIVLSQFISSVTVSILLVTATFRRYGFVFDLSVVRAVARFGWPLVPGALALIGLQHSRSYVLNTYDSLADVGIWSNGFKFGITVTLVLGQPLRNAWSAQMYGVWASPDGRRTYVRTGTVILAVVMGGATGLASLSREIITVFTTPEYARAAIVIPAVAFAFALREIADYFRNGLFVGGNTRAVAWIEPSLAVFDLLLGIVLVKHWGLVGAVVATPVVFGLYVIAMHQASRKVLPVQYEYGSMAAVVALALAISAVCIALHLPLLMAIGVKLAIVALYPLGVVLLVFRSPDEREAVRALRRRVVGW